MTEVIFTIVLSYKDEPTTKNKNRIRKVLTDAATHLAANGLYTDNGVDEDDNYLEIGEATVGISFTTTVI